MATIKSKNSPLHIKCEIGQPYGESSTGYSCGYHTGVDFPQSGTSETNPDLYSCVEGEVVYVYTTSTGSTPALGNQVQIKDDKTGYYFRYCHMVYGSITVGVGDRVTTKTKIGKMGTTGNSTGTHLHLECSTTQSWQCGNFLVPGDVLGFGNVRGTVIEYDEGSEPQPTDKWIYQAGALNETQMQNNAKVAYNYLSSKYNLSIEVISALLGNMERESTIEPWRNEVGGSGYGLVQWTPKSTLEKSVQELGLTDETNGNTQLDVLINEIKGTPSSINKWYSTEAFVRNYYASGATPDFIGVTGNQFLSNEMNWEPEKLAILFMVCYERPSYNTTDNRYDLRQEYTTKWFKYLGGSTPPEPPDPPKPPITTNKNYKKWGYFLSARKILIRRF